jgi:G3E family GTPase
MIPLVLLTGFLGAGKTTLMRAVIPQLTGHGLRASVILNDYRNAYIDAETFTGLTDHVVPIGGTCICCGSREALLEALVQAPLVMESIMLVEANGTADVPELIEILTADRAGARYTLPVQVVVVDVKRWQCRYFHDALERSHVPTASYVVLTRSDEVSAKRLLSVREDVRQLAPRARVVDPSGLAGCIAELHAAAPTLPARRFDPVVSDAQGQGRAHHHAHAHTHHFSSLEIPLPDRMDEARFRTFLEGLPPEVIRAKGIARLAPGDDAMVYFQKVEGRNGVTFHPIDAPLALDPVAIFIGVGLMPEPYTRAIASFRAGSCTPGATC